MGREGVQEELSSTVVNLMDNNDDGGGDDPGWVRENDGDGGDGDEENDGGGHKPHSNYHDDPWQSSLHHWHSVLQHLKLVHEDKSTW